MCSFLVRRWLLLSLGQGLHCSSGHRQQGAKDRIRSDRTRKSSRCSIDLRKLGERLRCHRNLYPKSESSSNRRILLPPCLLPSRLAPRTPLPLPPTRKTLSLRAIPMVDGERGQMVREARDTVVEDRNMDGLQLAGWRMLSNRLNQRLQARDTVV